MLEWGNVLLCEYIYCNISMDHATNPLRLLRHHWLNATTQCEKLSTEGTGHSLILLFRPQDRRCMYSGIKDAIDLSLVLSVGRHGYASSTINLSRKLWVPLICGA